jgi:hypothetical protein
MAIKDNTGKIIDKCLRVFTANIILLFVSEHEICSIKYKTDYHEKRSIVPGKTLLLPVHGINHVLLSANAGCH